MPVSFSVMQINKFPKCPKEEGTVLLQRGEKELFGQTPATRFTLKSASVGGKYEYYHVYHEAIRRQLGRTYDGHEFNAFFVRNDFSAYLDRSTNLLICSTAKRVARSLVDALNKDKPKSFNADYLRLDFQQIRPRVKEINGVWVSDMTQPFLRTMGLYGPHVDRSQMCKEAEALGVTNALLVSYEFSSSTYSVMVSADYCISFPGEIVEGLCLDILFDMQHRILAGATKVHESTFNERKRRAERKAETRPPNGDGAV